MLRADMPTIADSSSIVYPAGRDEKGFTPTSLTNGRMSTQ
ncbi:hypothetical protein C791_8562 [Amycolatopsis azurea DSM 43854]|uniref:Uncharacterized protein n=1 Tax=Amycolatopsis azurea DSM 43854 TaxID=1238180 RepID=M2Q8E8_9PSEU|nr:hypothetical protein C791_8562 [Amycolatopsis azurea DSM 43854]